MVENGPFTAVVGHTTKSNRVLVLRPEPHTIAVEGDGLKRLVQLIGDTYGDKKVEAICALREITKLALIDARNLIEAHYIDRELPTSALDEAIWRLLA